MSTRATTFEVSLERFHPRPIPFDNLLDMRNAIKVDLEFVKLLKDLSIARNLGICAQYHTIGLVVLQVCESLGFMAEILDPLVYASHEVIEIATKCRE